MSLLRHNKMTTSILDIMTQCYYSASSRVWCLDFSLVDDVHSPADNNNFMTFTSHAVKHQNTNLCKYIMCCCDKKSVDESCFAALQIIFACIIIHRANFYAGKITTFEMLQSLEIKQAIKAHSALRLNNRVTFSEPFCRF